MEVTKSPTSTFKWACVILESGPGLEPACRVRSEEATIGAISLLFLLPSRAFQTAGPRISERRRPESSSYQIVI